MSIRELHRVQPVDGYTLASVDPAATPGVDSKKDAKRQLRSLSGRLFDLHELAMANEQAVLVVLQGTDASGKSGTIKHVIRQMSPVGVRVADFQEPTEEEEEHHFLWRIEKQLPKPGHLGVFDRSQYEDVIVPMVDESLGTTEIDERVGEIVEFEKGLTGDGMIVLKFFLHISYEEQRRRFLRRLERDDKRWKFSRNDLETRRRWDDFQLAYADMLTRTDRANAPWYVVPADNKWYRNWVVASILVETLEQLDLSYPQPGWDIGPVVDSLQDSIS